MIDLLIIIVEHDTGCGGLSPLMVNKFTALISIRYLVKAFNPVSFTS